MKRRRFIRLSSLGALAAAGTAASSRNTRGAASGEKPIVADEEVETPTGGLQRIVWSVDTDKPIVALTFDDGPDPEFTPRILNVLDRYQTKATFMVMGHNAVEHPWLLRDVVRAGHEIGAHGWKHLNLAEASVEEVRNEIELGTRVIEEGAGVPVRVFRPPYGRLGEPALRLLAKSRRDIVIWSVTRGKLAWRDAEQIASHVVGSLRPGDIVDLHDGIGRGTFNRNLPVAKRLRDRREVELEGLPEILERTLARGLRFASTSDLIDAWQPKTSGA
jgi:peptidoglycan/xylan/chitin deacetylase (PgdA/CDA1 family)